MELSLGRKTLEVQRTDILAMRNWITQTMLHYGKQNGTSELDTPFLSREQKETDGAVLTPPRHARLRDIRNQGGTCAIIVVLQGCFQVPQLTRLLELTAHPQLDA
jgi:hypothetical protein